MVELLIRADEAGQRLDKYLAKYLNQAPKSFIYKSLRKKNIKLNGKKAEGHELLNEGDAIRLFFSDETFQTLRTEAGFMSMRTSSSGTASSGSFHSNSSLKSLALCNSEDSQNGSKNKEAFWRNIALSDSKDENRTFSEDNNEYQSVRPGALTSAHETGSAFSLSSYRQKESLASSLSGRRQEEISDSSVSGFRQGESPAFSLSDYCEIIYEDEHVIIANKRAGILSQKAEADDFSINEALLLYTREKQSASGIPASAAFTPSVCNRLDRNTSGLICFAKTYAAAREWNRLFQEREMKKYYLAVVSGEVREPVHAEGWLLKYKKNNQVRIFDRPEQGASRIETAFRSVSPKELKILMDQEHLHVAGLPPALPRGYSLVLVELITGKSHQIRAHLAHLGHPLAGDPKYADPAETARLRKAYGIRRQLLHAYTLELPEEVQSPMEDLRGCHFHAPLPDDMRRILGLH